MTYDGKLALRHRAPEPWLDEERLSKVLEVASEKFWAVIAQEYWEILTGDVDPFVALEWDEVVHRHVTEWLKSNSCSEPKLVKVNSLGYVCGCGKNLSWLPA